MTERIVVPLHGMGMHADVPKREFELAKEMRRRIFSLNTILRENGFREIQTEYLFVKGQYSVTVSIPRTVNSLDKIRWVMDKRGTSKAYRHKRFIFKTIVDVERISNAYKRDLINFIRFGRRG